jgi:hypothetical protein
MEGIKLGDIKMRRDIPQSRENLDNLMKKNQQVMVTICRKQ